RNSRGQKRARIRVERFQTGNGNPSDADPEGESNHVQKKKGNAAGKFGDAVRGFLDESAVVRRLFVHVAGGGVAQPFDILALTATHGREQIHGGEWTKFEEFFQILAFEAESSGIFERYDRGSAGAVVEHG